MRRRPRPFMLSASTSDGAALVVIVGLLCLPFSAFVALPAMLLTARLVDSNINWFVLVLIVLPVVAASACFIATPILAADRSSWNPAGCAFPVETAHAEALPYRVS